VTALVFNIIASILSAELLIYHIWLKCTGKTTYEHILERRKRAEEVKYNIPLENINVLFPDVL